MAMTVTPTLISDVLIIEPQVFGDERGFFMESFNQKDFNHALGQDITFVQDNHSRSKQGVLRGMHYQLEQTQGKLVRVIEGRVFDVVVDMRRSSPNYGRWFGLELSAENKKQLWIPAGLAHGFLVLSEQADFLYKTTDYYHPTSEQSLLWSDSTVGIEWPEMEVDIKVASKDSQGYSWHDAPKFD